MEMRSSSDLVLLLILLHFSAVVFGDEKSVDKTANSPSGRLDIDIESQLMELNPNPYKYHQFQACISNNDCLAVHGGCRHPQYIGDADAKLNPEHRPKCYQPLGTSRSGVCLCPECVTDIHCNRQSRCPHSLSGQCVNVNMVSVCQCGKTKKDLGSVTGRYSSFWESVVCQNILLVRLMPWMVCRR